jgi:D-alanine-D-alanine ligase
MVRPGSDFSFRDVVLVADVEEEAPRPEVDQRRDLEKTDASTLQILLKAIRALGLRVHHYGSPGELARAAHKHSDDVVLTIYGGQNSRNRMALVPAICETFGLRFVGPDVYGRIIAQDKEVSKRLAVDIGLRTPPWRVVRSEADVDRLASLQGFHVAKPLMEGSSIGITSRSLQGASSELQAVALDLIRRFNQPVIVEAFVPGREVSYVKIESPSDDLWALSEVVIAGQPEYFETRLFDVHEKLHRSPQRSVANIDGELLIEDKISLDRLLRTFGRYGYCRIDGRLKDGEFHFIEMTPDAWLAPGGQFAMAFTEKGWSYPEVIAAVLASEA